MTFEVGQETEGLGASSQEAGTKSIITIRPKVRQRLSENGKGWGPAEVRANSHKVPEVLRFWHSHSFLTQSEIALKREKRTSDCEMML